MFTGIIEETGLVKHIGNHHISVSCTKILQDINIGDSISVNGVCLTVVSFDKNGFSADVSDETLKVTNLKDLSVGDIVNLERAMLATSRFGGHIVTGHIDCVARISKLHQQGEFYILEISLPQKNFSKYVVKKGSISINGISLTVCDINDLTVQVALIPHTFDNTNIKTLSVGSVVNVEFDILAKYVEKNILMKDNSNITEDFLRENGFM